ncbi:MAG: coniferyl aldehyde dehydrogenase [Alphaproteobacteria bacterium]|nr:coniferyl aldehyde dehydrogenase [Alphaproteobacteria bacterium]
MTKAGSMHPEETPSAKTLAHLFAAQKEAFRRTAPSPCGQRIEALRTLKSALLRHRSEFVDALNADFGNRARQETELLEIVPIIEEIRHIKRRLRGWMRPRSAFASWPLLPSRTRIVHQPLGVVGIVGAWNYPLYLTLSPLTNALAAGNHAMVKPSELAPNTAVLIARMVADTFPSEQVTVIEGGPETAEAFTALPFDHLLFTGSSRVGKLVMGAASNNLTPVTLELGGKSPALVHAEFSQAIAADRICSAKLLNAGQTCVAPDYALVAKAQAEHFVAATERSIARRYPSLLANADYTRMIDATAWQRMAALVEDAGSKGARVVRINPAGEDSMPENRVFPPTLLLDVDASMQAMQEEIFGPVLPIMTYGSLDEAIAIIEDRPRPLALYYFDNNAGRIRHVLEHTTSGGMTVNDCMLHVADSRLPFGGVGSSGMGAYHGRTGFETFSHRKGVLLESGLTGRLLDRMLRPPYGRTFDRLVRFLTGTSNGPDQKSDAVSPQ